MASDKNDPIPLHKPAARPARVPAPEMPVGGFPANRMRRNRRTAWSRNLVAENALSAHDFIWPIFIQDGDNKRDAVPSMPGVDRLSIDLAVEAAAQAVELDIPVIALSAHAMVGDRETALDAGCDDYDTKPVEFQRLLDKIKTLLDASGAD